MKKKAMHVPDMLCESYHYDKPVPFSRGMRVDIKGITFLYISGTASVNEKGKTIHKGNLRAQARRAFDNITALLRSEGATWHDVVRTTIFLKDIRQDYHEFNKERNLFYREQGLDPFPASTCVEARLCRDDLLVEMEAIVIMEKPERYESDNKHLKNGNIPEKAT